MRPITKPNGEVYCLVGVDESQLRIKLNQGSAAGLTIALDAKIIPQLKQLLTEAEFLKYI